MTVAKKRGRPKGSKTKKAPTVIVKKSSCSNCGSTERTPYDGHGTVSTFRTPLIDQDGKPYNRITTRRTRCLNCGQCRTDQIREMVSGE